MKLYLALALAAFSIPVLAADKTLHVTVDGKDVEFHGGQPASLHGRTMVPLRGVFEAIGATVEYDEVSHKVTAHRGNESVDLTIGEKIAHKNGIEILVDTAPAIIKGSTLVPLRFLAESLGAKVTYDGATGHVDIVTQ